MESFPNGYKALVIGASGGIGAALVARLEQDSICDSVVGLSRTTTPPIDFDQESTIPEAARQLGDQGPFHLIIDATGVLKDGDAFPEKSIRHFTAQSLSRAFAINAIGPALLMQHFYPLLPKTGKGVFATLSARVGSIEDNSLGGWYGYRASKAALNMLLRTASLDIARKRPNAICLSLHPGTVRTPLSEPFIGDRKVFTPDKSARLLLATIDKSTPTDNGSFKAYDGSNIKW